MCVWLCYFYLLKAFRSTNKWCATGSSTCANAVDIVCVCVCVFVRARACACVRACVGKRVCMCVFEGVCELQRNTRDALFDKNMGLVR